jgi:hypothetical protein
MIVNMACPKCGGQATEYDDKKWSCLRCGNKFIYAPVQPSHTFVQSNVHIQGQATFELDAKNAKPPVPKTAKIDNLTKSITENTHRIAGINRRISSHKVIKRIALYFTVLIGGPGLMVIIVALVGSFSDKDFPGDGGENVGFLLVLCTVLGMLLIGPVAAFVIFRNKIREDNSLMQKLQQTISSLEQQNLADTKVGEYVICPYCENAAHYVPLNSPPPVEGLKHCLKCGRQFFTSGLNSYPVVFKK